MYIMFRHLYTDSSLHICVVLVRVVQADEYLGDFDGRGAVDEPTAEIHPRAHKPGLPVIHLHRLATDSCGKDTKKEKDLHQ